MPNNNITHSTTGSGLADILERILDKGVVIAGDISVAIADVELLTIRIRLIVASIDKAVEMGIDWWRTDPYISSTAKKEMEEKDAKKLEEDKDIKRLGEENKSLIERLEKLEGRLEP